MSGRSSRLPQVVIGSASKFWTFHQARGAEQAGMLHRLIVPLADKTETGVPLEKIKNIPWPAYAAFAISRLPFPQSLYWSYYVGDNWFDLVARRHIGGADICHFYNNHGLYTFREAKKQGMITIVERSSAHPVYQHEILRQEYEHLGLKLPGVVKPLVDKHVQEYVEADWIIVTSEFIRRSMIAGGVPAEKMRLIPLGFAPDRFFPTPKGDDKFRVIYAGQLCVRKGLHYLLAAWKIAGLPPEKSELLLVGDIQPDAHNFLPKYHGTYRHIPFVPNSQLPGLYNSGSVFCLPSLEDGYPMVMCEAAACGLPIIVSTNTGTFTRDGEDGFIVPIRNADAIAGKLTYLYQHEVERQRMGQLARERILQFDWAYNQRELIRFYSEIWKHAS